MDLNNKKIAVVGFSERTGLSLVKYLNNKAADIIISDSKSREELEALISQIDKENVEFDFGSNSKKILEADLIILSPGVPYDLDLLIEARKKGIETISEVEFAYRNTKAEIIAVTGTNGKTTTTDLLYKMLKNLKGRKVYKAGNIGIPFISIVDKLKEDDLVVLELSSFQLEAVKAFRANTALYLNYSPDHLDRHKTEAKYKEAKKKIFAEQKESDYAVIDLDDQYLAELQEEITASLYTISSKNDDADLLLFNNKLIYRKNDNEQIELLDFNYINLPGKHNRKNAAFAALAAYFNGQKISEIQKEAEKYVLKDHRMQKIDNEKGYLIIDDSKATNPSAAVQALKSVNKDVILIAGGQDRNADFTKFIEEINKKTKKLLLIGETAKKIANYNNGKGLKNEIEIKIFDKLETAAEYGAKSLDSDNCLILSPGCPSWDMFPSYKVRGDIFQAVVLENI